MGGASSPICRTPTCAASRNWPAFRSAGWSAADAFGTTVAQGLAHTGVSLVEVDMQKVGEFPAYFPFNQRR